MKHDTEAYFPFVGFRFGDAQPTPTTELQVSRRNRRVLTDPVRHWKSRQAFL